MLELWQNGNGAVPAHERQACLLRRLLQPPPRLVPDPIRDSRGAPARRGSGLLCDRPRNLPRGNEFGGKWMYPWTLTAGQQELVSFAAEFARSEIAPIATQSEIDRCVEPQVSERFHAAGVGQKFLDADFVNFASSACLVAEELSHACAAYASYLMLPVFFNRLVASYLDRANPRRVPGRVPRTACRDVVRGLGGRRRQRHDGADRLARRGRKAAMC